MGGDLRSRWCEEDGRCIPGQKGKALIRPECLGVAVFSPLALLGALGDGQQFPHSPLAA